MNAFRLALGFLTILPVGRFESGVSDEQVAASRFAYPVVGLAMGLLLALLSRLLARFGLSAGPSAWGIVASSALLTGGLHLDGTADTLDGLFLRGDRSRRLAAMKDPHVGSFGAAGLVLILLGQFAALEVLTGRDRALALIGAFTASRTLILVAAGSAAYARPEGTGRMVIDAAKPVEAFWASLGVLVMGAAVGGVRGLVAGGLSLAVAALWIKLSLRNLGGITGDVLGAVVETSGLAFLIGFGLYRG